jgi:pseudouridine-5'-phosphate glycosidase
MKVVNKITGKDMTSYLINKWEKEYEAKSLQKKIARTYELDKLLTKLSKKNGVTKY